MAHLSMSMYMSLPYSERILSGFMTLKRRPTSNTSCRSHPRHQTPASNGPTKAYTSNPSPARKLPRLRTLSLGRLLREIVIPTRSSLRAGRLHE